LTVTPFVVLRRRFLVSEKVILHAQSFLEGFFLLAHEMEHLAASFFAVATISAGSVRKVWLRFQRLGNCGRLSHHCTSL
jgi:hypothetical protein